MSGVTDSLIKLASQVSASPTEREMDVLLATGRADDDRADGDGDQRLGRQGGVADRRAGRDHHRRRAHQGEDREHHAESGPPSARRRSRRHRRWFSGRDERWAHHDARAGRQRSHRDRDRFGGQGRSVPDFHRRGRRLFVRSAHRADGAEDRRNQLRRNARNGVEWIEGDAVALGRVRQEIWRHFRSAQQLQREPRNHRQRRNHEHGKRRRPRH